MLQSGQVLLDKYRVERILGEGGMGMVALAQHVQLGTPVAIKFLRPQFLTEANLTKRFLREAQAAARLQSEHVCRVFDVGTLESGAPYMVMEYMEGTDLRELARTQGPLASGVVVDYLLQACEALAEAHAQRIVHRDLKPANLFVARRPDGTTILKVLDFGISKVHSNIDEEITHTNTILGTPAYMSPEQMRSAKAADARSDIWSLGIILFELLSGSRPFPGKAFTALILRINTDPTPPMTVPQPPGLEDVVRRCLEKEPADRYQNVHELARALAPYAASERVASTALERASRLIGAVPVPIEPVARAQTAEPWVADERSATTLGGSLGEMSDIEPATRVDPPRRTWLYAVIAVVVVLAAGLGFGLGRQGDSEPPAVAPPIGDSTTGTPGVADADADADAAASVPVATVIDAGVADAQPADAKPTSVANTAKKPPTSRPRSKKPRPETKTKTRMKNKNKNEDPEVSDWEAE